MVTNKSYIPKTKYYAKKYWKRDGLYFQKRYKDLPYKSYVLIPAQWRAVIFTLHQVNSLQQIFLFRLITPVYYFNFSFSLTVGYFYFCQNTNVVTFSTFSQSDTASLWKNMLNNLLFLFSSFFFHKIKFKGKGYYIYKNFRNTIAPQFGYYHKIYIYSFFNKVKFLSKTKILLFGLVKTDVLTTAFELKAKRPMNIFTGRGVRFARQIVYKKTGKVSSYR